MSKTEVSILVKSISSDQDWTTDPSMLEVRIPSSFLDKAELCVAFMREYNVASMYVYDCVSTTLYREADEFDDDASAKPHLKDAEGKPYAEFTPEYTLDGDHARIYQNGEIYVSLPFKYVSGEVRGLIGELDYLKTLLK